MAETFTLTKVTYQGEKPNPRKPTQTLHKHKVSLLAESSDGDAVHDVYWQSVAQHHEGEEVYGDIEEGEYGPRFRTAQKPDGSGNQGSSGGTFNRHFERVPDKHDDQRWSIERQVAAKCAAEVLKGGTDFSAEAIDYLVDAFHDAIRGNDADVGGGSTQAIHDAPPVAADVSAEQSVGTLAKNRGPVTADVSAEPRMRSGEPIRESSSWQTTPEASVEASPAQKGKLTTLMGKANLSRDAMKAVVLFRCRSEKATKDGASKLIQDLMDGATHDTLLAEIHDAKRAGDPLAVRAAALIPSDTPLAEPEPEVVPPNGDDKVPF